jgi:hypothetical protein
MKVTRAALTVVLALGRALRSFLDLLVALPHGEECEDHRVGDLPPRPPAGSEARATFCC